MLKALGDGFNGFGGPVEDVRHTPDTSAEVDRLSGTTDHATEASIHDHATAVVPPNALTRTSDEWFALRR